MNSARGVVYTYMVPKQLLRERVFLESRGIKVEAFLVSNRYENPDSLHGKPVFRIEDIVNKSIPMNVTCVGISARIVKTGIEWDRNEHNEY